MNRIERKWQQRIEGRRRRGVCFMGGGDTPPPDPRMGAAAEQNAEVGREALAFNRQVYEENKPRQAAMDALSNQVIEQYMATQEKSSAQADDYMSYMKTTFRPLEQSLADEAKNFDTDAKREELAARAGADVEQAAGAADANARRDAARFGINPSDAAFSESMAGSSLNKAAMKSGTMTNARVAARAEGRAMKFDAAGLGRGLPGAGATSTQLAMQAGSGALGAAQAPMASNNASAGLMNQGFATSVGATGSAANIYSGIYQGQLQGQATEQSGNNATMGMIGAGVGAAAMIFV